MTLPGSAVHTHSTFGYEYKRYLYGDRALSDAATLYFQRHGKQICRPVYSTGQAFASSC